MKLTSTKSGIKFFFKNGKTVKEPDLAFISRLLKIYDIEMTFTKKSKRWI